MCTQLSILFDWIYRIVHGDQLYMIVCFCRVLTILTTICILPKHQGGCYEHQLRVVGPFFFFMPNIFLIHLKVHLTLSICTLIISIRRQFTSNKNNVDLQYIYCFVLRVPRWKVALISIIVFRKYINWRYECWWAIKRYLWYDSRLGEGIL